MNVSRIGLAEERPLVALVCQVPLIAEAISSALEEIAEVRVFPAGAAAPTASSARSTRTA